MKKQSEAMLPCSCATCQCVTDDCHAYEFIEDGSCSGGPDPGPWCYDCPVLDRCGERSEGLLMKIKELEEKLKEKDASCPRDCENYMLGPLGPHCKERLEIDHFLYITPGPKCPKRESKGE